MRSTDWSLAHRSPLLVTGYGLLLWCHLSPFCQGSLWPERMLAALRGYRDRDQNPVLTACLHLGEPTKMGYLDRGHTTTIPPALVVHDTEIYLQLLLPPPSSIAILKSNNLYTPATPSISIFPTSLWIMYCTPGRMAYQQPLAVSFPSLCGICAEDVSRLQ